MQGIGVGRVVGGGATAHALVQAARLALLVVLVPPCSVATGTGADADRTWAFAPAHDDFSPEAMLDLRNLNEPVAGAGGWIRTTPAGDFAKGDGTPIRFWAVNTSVQRSRPFVARPRWSSQEPDLVHHARWLAKRGVNMVRCHAHINPGLKANPAARLTDVNRAELEWIWRTAGAMKREGIYMTVSPYWANTMLSDDARFGTDWQGSHHGLLFFEPALQEAYKQWLRALFTTHTPLLAGRTLAEEPALAIFQIQNEDSLLFWTSQHLKDGPRRRLGRLFGRWAAARYGSLEKALAAWGGKPMKGDDMAVGVLDLKLVWDMTADARRQGAGRGGRVDDQLQFWAETMRAFNAEIARFVHEELGCPVLVNAGNWKTADDVLLNDAERYSYTVNDVIAVNRYFGGIHQGAQRGWAIVKGDRYTSDSVLSGASRSFPLAIKQVKGFPTLITESAWVFPNGYAAEAPLLVSAYSGLTGIDAYYWFATGTEEWVPPQSANGYLPSQQKWIFATPEMAGQFPAAALAFRNGYVARGKAVVEEHRSLESLWKRRTPILAEASGFDPLRDAGDIAPTSAIRTGVDPLAFFAGPVEVVYDSSETQSHVVPQLESCIQHHADGVVVRSITHEIVLDTRQGAVTVNTPKCQAVAVHFDRRQRFLLQDVQITCRNDHAAVMVVSLDDKPLAISSRVLVQVGTRSRPTGWETRPVQVTPKGGVPVPGLEVVDYGRAPWQVICPQVDLLFRNRALATATVLDMNGMAVRTLPIRDGHLEFPADAMYVIVEGAGTVR